LLVSRSCFVFVFVGMTDEINKAMARLDDTLEGEIEGTYSDYLAETFKDCKNLAKFAQDMHGAQG